MDMMKAIALGIFGVVLWLLSDVFFIVQESQSALLLRFNRVVRNNIEPGLHYKIPIIEEAKHFDARVRTLDADASQYLTQEKKRLIVDSFVMWRINDVEKFYTRTSGITARAEALLSPRINDGLKNKIAERTLHEVVSGEREEIMVSLQEALNEITLTELGIEVVDIRVKQVEFPSSVSEQVYNRMRAERQRDAREHRSQGKEVAEGIRATADKEEQVILAEAYRTAESLKGEGDAEAASIFAKAYEKNTAFYAFYRSLQAYRQTFNSKNDMVIIKPDSDFFDFMKNLDGQ